MSWAEDMGYDSYDPPEDDWEDDRFYVLKNGTEICNNCGSKNIKISAKGNKYCAELCWVTPAQTSTPSEEPTNEHTT